MRITKTGLGIDIAIDYVTDLKNAKTIHVTVDRENGTVNPSMAGSLNAAGREALKDAIAVAEVILKHGIVLPTTDK